MKTLARRSWLPLAVIVGLVGYAAWKYVAKPALARRDSYEGTIMEKYDKAHGQYARYSYHWKVKCTDGKVRSVDVPRSLWIMSHLNEPVRKVRGERWPRLPRVDESPGRKLLDGLLSNPP